MATSPKKLWERFLFRDKGILPAGGLLILFVAFSVCVSLLVTVTEIAWHWVFIINGLFLLISLCDLFFSPKKDELTFERIIYHKMERSISYSVEIHLRNNSTRPVKIRLKDDVPETFHVEFPLEGSVKEGSVGTLTYQVTPSVRGKYDLNHLYIRYRSVFGLWQKQMVVEIEDMVKVIPDLTETKTYLDDVQRFLLFEGIKLRKYREGSGEFSQIRNYVVGDDPRKINWRQTAKLQEVMTNEYEPEHGKHITILIDCGRMMGVELSEGNRLDKVLDAAIVTAAAALRNGDSVGVIAFAKDINAYIPPAKGMRHLQKLLESIYELKAEPYESNYPEVLSYLELVQKKRSLMLLFSDIHTFLHEEGSLLLFKRLQRRHLFLMVGIKDQTLLLRAGESPKDVRTAMTKSVAQEQINIKKREKIKWEAQGLLMAEASEEDLATTAVSHYIRIMNQGLL